MTPQDHRLLCPWDSLGKNAGVSCHALLQGIFQTPGLNLCLLHWQEDAAPWEAAGVSLPGILTSLQAMVGTFCLVEISSSVSKGENIVS